MFVCRECCVLSVRGLCDGLITRTEDTKCGRSECDVETSIRGRPGPLGAVGQNNKKNQTDIADTGPSLRPEREIGFAYRQGQEVQLFFKYSKPAVGPNQPPIQRNLEALSSGT
jgi:hypothetical protein